MHSLVINGSPKGEHSITLQTVRYLEKVYALLGELLGNLCTVINPEAVVIGGGVSKAGEVLLEGIKPHFARYVFSGAGDVTFALASLGNDAGAYGAFKLALDACKG